MIIVSHEHGPLICKIFAESYFELPGTWSGIAQQDIVNLSLGTGDYSTEEGWLRNKIYDSAWIEVAENARYHDADGVSYHLEQDAVGNLVLIKDCPEVEAGK